MSTLRKLAETAYRVATARPTSDTGIDAIEDAIQAAVNDAGKRPCAEHEETLGVALERVKRLEEALRAACAAVTGEWPRDPAHQLDVRASIAVRITKALRPEGT